jgi:hypothetical protein
MKKRYNISFIDISLIEVTDILATLFLVGLAFRFFNTTAVSAFLSEWALAFLALAIITGVKPTYRLLKGEKGLDAEPVKKAPAKKAATKKAVVKKTSAKKKPTVKKTPAKKKVVKKATKKSSTKKKK